MQGDRELCLAAGMDDYISKPIRVEDLRTALTRWGRPSKTNITAASAQDSLGESQTSDLSPA
jgi:two-component system sensor histidine kinase/response regulator